MENYIDKRVSWGSIITSAFIVTSGLIQWSISQNFATKEDLKEYNQRIERRLEQLESDKVEKETFDVYKMYIEEKFNK